MTLIGSVCKYGGVLSFSVLIAPEAWLHNDALYRAQIGIQRPHNEHLSEPLDFGVIITHWFPFGAVLLAQMLRV